MNKQVIWKINWQNGVLIFIATALLLLAYWDGFSQLFIRWDKQEEYSHGYLLPVLTLYFIWLKKNEVVQSEFSPSWLGFLLYYLLWVSFL